MQAGIPRYRNQYPSNSFYLLGYQFRTDQKSIDK